MPVGSATMLTKGTPSPPKNILSILLIQLGDLGDVVLTSPTLRALRESFPASRIHAVLREKARGLLEDSPWVDEMIYLRKRDRGFFKEMAYQKSFLGNLRKKHLQVAIDLRTGTRGAILSFMSGAPFRIGRYAEDGKLWRNRLFTHLVQPENELSQHCAEHGLNIVAPLGAGTQNKLPLLFTSPENERRALALLKQESVPFPSPIIAIQPFSLWSYKEWPFFNYVRLIRWITSTFSLPVLIIGSADESVRASELARAAGPETYSVAGKTSLADLKAVLRMCGLLIGCDSAGMHIAAAVGTPTVALFGPSSPVSWAPRGDKHLVISKPWSCVPCRKKGCYDTKISRCMENLTFDEVRVGVERQIVALLNGEKGLRKRPDRKALST